MPVAPIIASHHPDCYPSTERAALRFFREALASYDSSKLPQPLKGELLGITTPHIDYRVSLQAYAAAFGPLMEVPLAETYVILGVGHRSSLEWNLDRRDYITPLGRVACAVDLVDQLAGGVPPARIFGRGAHHGEHSIEFALLWLQALHRLHPTGGSTDFRFVPLLCGSMHAYVEGMVEWDAMSDFHQLSQVLGTLIREMGDSLRIIVSIDGCHLGPRFHHPFKVTPVLLKTTSGWENLLWSCAEKGDSRVFLDWFRQEGNDRHFDGVGALALLLAAGPGNLQLQRTYYEQWFTEQDASAVTFSSGRIFRL